MSTLAFSQLEAVYDELAQAIDQVGPEGEAVFLTKLVLSLAHEYGDGARVSALIKQCLREKSPESGAARLI